MTNAGLLQRLKSLSDILIIHFIYMLGLLAIPDKKKKNTGNFGKLSSNHKTKQKKLNGHVCLFPPLNRFYTPPRLVYVCICKDTIWRRWYVCGIHKMRSVIDLPDNPIK